MRPPSTYGSELLVTRFNAKVIVNDQSGCHEWQGCRHSNGYGQMNVNQVTEYAHRIAWKLAGKKIPKGKHVLHKCDNRRCVNVDHMFLGDQALNMADKKAKGRTQMYGLIGPTVTPWKPVPQWRRGW